MGDEEHPKPNKSVAPRLVKPRFQCQLSCTNFEASDEVPLAVFANATRRQCYSACAGNPRCNAVVYSEHPHVCQGIAAPTAPLEEDMWDDLHSSWLRPFPGVQLGACAPAHPPPVGWPKRCKKPVPYEWGQETTFLAGKTPPWSKCGVFGDLYVLPFDVPHADKDCSASELWGDHLNVIED